MTEKPTREEMAASHDPRTCPKCCAERHGDQAEDEETLELLRLRAEHAECLDLIAQSRPHPLSQGMRLPDWIRLAAEHLRRSEQERVRLDGEAIGLRAEVAKLKARVESAFALQHRSSVDCANERAAWEMEAEELRRRVNEARAATVEANQALAEMTASRDSIAGTLDAVLLSSNQAMNHAREDERSKLATLANEHLNEVPAMAIHQSSDWKRGYRDACADIETAIRSRKP